jgi:hypothetical protein
LCVIGRFFAGAFAVVARARYDRSMFKSLACVAVIAGSAIAQPKQTPKPMVKPQPNLVAVIVEQAVDSGDASPVPQAMKFSLQGDLAAEAVREKLVACAPAGRDAAMVLVQVGKTKSRAISTGRTVAMKACVESVVSSVTGAEITATLRIVWDPKAVQPKPGKAADIRPNPY